MLLSTLPIHASVDNDSFKSVLHRIDWTIEHYDEYVAKKRQRIQELKQKLWTANGTRSKYELAYRLYQEYTPFQNDSAIHYLECCTSLARNMGDESRAGGCTALMALSCSNAGMYLEAATILKNIDADKLHDTDLGLYYYAMTHMSGEMVYYANVGYVKRQYSDDANRYSQLLLKHLPPTNKYAHQCSEMLAMKRGDYRLALTMNTRWLKTVKRSSTEYALVCYLRYLEYKALGDSVQMAQWLAESVTSDVENAVMDQGSMWEMANLLMSKGDVDRSYRYICFTSDCADKFGSRQRLSHISPLLSRIAQSYKAEVERKARSLRHTILLVSLLSLLLLTAFAYVCRKRSQLAVIRDQLAHSNTQLTALNSQLTSLNKQLTEANRVKEEYVGRFMQLCSLYIDKLDNLRKQVSKRVKNRQYAELAELTRSTDYREKEVSALYDNFDKAFLHLFPTFVEEFNALLKPEHQIALADKSSLTTVIRIFALIRLGITDSSKIAEFLHYSVNTIYNYRANTKNWAVCDRADFENKVKNIG